MVVENALDEASDFYDEMCMINCFSCLDIEGLDLHQVIKICPEADHNECFICIYCLKRLQSELAIKPSLLFYSPCHTKINVNGNNFDYKENNQDKTFHQKGKMRIKIK